MPTVQWVEPRFRPARSGVKSYGGHERHVGTSADAPLDLPHSLPGSGAHRTATRRTPTSPALVDPGKSNVPLVQTACRWACASARAVAKLSLQDVGPVGKRIGSGTFPVHCPAPSGAASERTLAPAWYQ